MPRGYRCIIVALVGWLSLAAQHPDPTAKTQQQQARQAEAQARKDVAAAKAAEEAERAHRAKYEAECNPGDDKRDSDLCAQWKAADATTDSAWWTAVGTWVSGVSGLLVIAALYLAFQSNRIARDTAKRQLRAYLHVTDCDQTDVGVGQSTVANITVTNGGQTPAHDVTIEVVLGRRTLPLAANAFDLGEDEDPPSKLVIGPGKPAYSRTAMPAMTQAEHTAFQSGQSAYFTYGRIIYRDVFNERHQSLFRMKLEKTGEWQLCAEGNEAD